jgi:outer membrane usher protein
VPFAVRKALTEPEACTDLAHLLPDATVKFDADKQQLNIAVPQIYLQRTARGNVDPSLWDSGVPALMLGYYMNGYESHYSNAETSRTFYSSLNAGLNIGKWYFRHNGSYNWDQTTGGSYQSTNTYVQRDTEFVRGHLYLGQYFTSGQMFNSVSYTGAQLATDDRMLPASQRGYAPEIRGIAKTNAKVTVRQSGNILYQTTVSPGAFLIDDLGPTGYGGDWTSPSKKPMAAPSSTRCRIHPWRSRCVRARRSLRPRRVSCGITAPPKSRCFSRPLICAG